MPANNSNSNYYIHRKNSSDKLRDVATGVCATRTKLSKPIYTHIKHFNSEKGNSTYVTDIDGMRMHTGRTFAHDCSLDSSTEDDTELDELIEYHANVSEKDSRHYYESEIPLSSSEDNEIFSQVSWLDPKFDSEQSQETSEVCSEHSTGDKDIKHNGSSDENYEIKISIQETPKRVKLKQFDRSRKFKRKPIRLANLTRKIYTKGMDETRIAKEDIQILEPNSDIETFDIKKYLAKTRRRLSFPLEDSFKVSSSSLVTSTLEEDLNLTKNSNNARDTEKIALKEEIKSLEQMRPIKEESGGSFLLKDYLSKLEQIATKPPTTKRAKAFEQRISSKTYFDFDDYCNKIFYLKEKFTNYKNKGETI